MINFRDKDWLLSHKLQTKKLIFLDTCFWCKYIDNKQKYIDIVKILKKLVSDNKIHIVVNLSLLAEIALRDDDIQTDEIFNLIQELTSNVYLRYHETIMKLELQAQQTEKKINVNECFGCLWETCKDLELKENHFFKIPKKELYVKELRKKFYAKNPSNFPWNTFKKLGKELKIAWSNLVQDQKYNRKSSIEKAIKDQQDLNFGKFIIDNTADAIKMIQNSKKSMSKKEAAKAFQKMKDNYNSTPTKYALLHLIEHLKWGKNIIKSNDIYDTIHIGTVIPYCDIIFCDKDARETCKRAKLDTKFQTKIYAEPEIKELKQTLEQL